MEQSSGACISHKPMMLIAYPPMFPQHL